RRIITGLGGEPFELRGEAKALYHAWGSFCSPLLIALLALGEEVAEAAGIPKADAARAAKPLVRRTIENYIQSGAAAAFSGPLARGDLATIARNLEALRTLPRAQAIYALLARSALHNLPVRNRSQLRRLLGEDEAS